MRHKKHENVTVYMLDNMLKFWVWGFMLFVFWTIVMLILILIEYLKLII